MKINSSKLELLTAMQGLNFRKLAEKSGVSRQSISTAKTRGTCNPLTAIKLANALGVEVEELSDNN